MRQGRGVSKPEAERRTEQVTIALTKEERAGVDRRRAELSPDPLDPIPPGAYFRALLRKDIQRAARKHMGRQA